ncbi:hypothetical protein [Streptomyces cadmiisoli]|uniref:Uncharacterized protein n=1 Tax=Streptomyces cadmiisoli TaxID=2184053 RepID=A0A2Z4J853_9ACTN|nr:hypothetical protein [Streptomyces cadmiisoli]AWW41392.1 hypothetical protein DN051_35900 [Streptomyces cadmiisoli]
MVFNLVSLVLSLLALGTSAWGVYRQVGRARAASDLAMTTDLLLTHIRDEDFQRDQLWVIYELPDEHGPENGIEGLPYPANYRVWNVAFVYESVSIMLRYDIVTPVILISLAQHRLIRTWETLEPYISAERARRGRLVFPFFEDAYVLAKEVDPHVFYADVGLRRSDGTPRPPTAPGRGRLARATRRWRTTESGRRRALRQMRARSYRP